VDQTGKGPPSSAHPGTYRGPAGYALRRGQQPQRTNSAIGRQSNRSSATNL